MGGGLGRRVHQALIDLPLNFRVSLKSPLEKGEADMKKRFGEERTIGFLKQSVVRGERR